MFKEMEGVRVEDDVHIQGRVSAVCHVFSVADSAVPVLRRKQQEALSFLGNCWALADSRV